MARIRYLKMGFFENEDLATLSAHHRLTFEGLWLLADKAGRLEDRPKRIHAKLFPYEAGLDMEQILHDLTAAHFITRYVVGEKRLIRVLNFHEHQRPRHDEPASILPAQPQDALGQPIQDDTRTPAEAPHEQQLTETVTDRTLDRRESPPGIGIGIGIGMGRGLGPHLKHAMCGRVCLHESQFSQFCQLLGSTQADPDAYVRTFFRGWTERYTDGDRAQLLPEPDMFDFWRARWKETHPRAAVVMVTKASTVGRRSQVPSHEPL